MLFLTKMPYTEILKDKCSDLCPVVFFANRNGVVQSQWMTSNHSCCLIIWNNTWHCFPFKFSNCAMSKYFMLPLLTSQLTFPSSSLSTGPFFLLLWENISHRSRTPWLSQNKTMSLLQTSLPIIKYPHKGCPWVSAPPTACRAHSCSFLLRLLQPIFHITTPVYVKQRKHLTFSLHHSSLLSELDPQVHF